MSHRNSENISNNNLFPRPHYNKYKKRHQNDILAKSKSSKNVVNSSLRSTGRSLSSSSTKSKKNQSSNSNSKQNQQNSISPPSSQNSSRSSDRSDSSHSSHQNKRKPMVPPIVTSHPPYQHMNQHMNHHQSKPTLPHLMRQSPKLKHATSTATLIAPKYIKQSSHNSYSPKNMNNTLTKPRNNRLKRKKNIPLFHQIQMDVNAYIQRFYYYANKKGWFSNEYRISSDCISCQPLTSSELLSIHNKSYVETILNDDIRYTSKEYLYILETRIGGSYNKIHSDKCYGVYQRFIDKNNHISSVYNNEVIYEILHNINILDYIGSTGNWNKYRTALINNISDRLRGPYKSYSLEIFKKLLMREYKTYVILNKLITSNKRDLNRSRSLVLLPDADESDLSTDTEDDVNGNRKNDDMKTEPKLNANIILKKMVEKRNKLVELLNGVKNELNKKNTQILSDIKSYKNNDNNGSKLASLSALSSSKQLPLSSDVQGELNDYNKIQFPSEISSLYDDIKKSFKYLSTCNMNGTTSSAYIKSGKAITDEIDKLYNDIIAIKNLGVSLLSSKYKSIFYISKLNTIKKQFHSKNKRFKKEIKDKIMVIKQINLNKTYNKKIYNKMKSSIIKIIQFVKHNMNSGTMEILKTMLKSCKSINQPHSNNNLNNICNCNTIYECNLIYKSIISELEKQILKCNELLLKLQDYGLKKQKKIQIKLTKLGLLSLSGSVDDDGPEFDSDEYHGEDVIYRNNVGEYEKKYLCVIWGIKKYRIYENELSFQNGKLALLEATFRATDYSYCGPVAVSVRRSNKSKKTSTYRGVQFMLSKHLFVVADIQTNKYWRVYIQRGENTRKLSIDFDNKFRIKQRNNNYDSSNTNTTTTSSSTNRRNRTPRTIRSSSAHFV